MTGQTSRARNAAKCARCGHPRAKHTTNPADGCTVRTSHAISNAGRPWRRVLTCCGCRYFVEGPS